MTQRSKAAFNLYRERETSLLAGGAGRAHRARVLLHFLVLHLGALHAAIGVAHRAAGGGVLCENGGNREEGEAEGGDHDLFHLGIAPYLLEL